MPVLRCPFYKDHALDTITCERLSGPPERGEHHFFESGMRVHLKTYCCHITDWRKCEYAKLLLQKYGG